MKGMGKKLDASAMLWVVILAVIGVYLWGQLFVGGEFVAPSSELASSAGLWVLKFIIIGLLVIVAVNLVTKISTTAMGKRDVFTLVVLVVIVYFAYVYVFQPILGANSLGDIAFDAGSKLGLYG